MVRKVLRDNPLYIICRLVHNRYLYRISRVYKLFIVYRFTVIVCIYGRNCSLKHKTLMFVRSECLLNSEKFCSPLILQILNPFATIHIYLFSFMFRTESRSVMFGPEMKIHKCSVFDHVFAVHPL